MVLPSPGNLLARISKGNSGVVESEYPYAYAHRFITSYPETVPPEIHSKVAGDIRCSTSARTAAATLQFWADEVEADKHELAKILADAYLSKHYSTSNN